MLTAETRTRTAETETASLAERSLSGCQWQLRPAAEGQATALARDFGIPNVLARVLLARQVTPENAHDFLHPSIKAALPDPSHLKDMDTAAERLARAIMQGETVAVFGDYDVDGATSSALLIHFLRETGAKTLLYIPDRMREGYGPNAPALLALKEQGAAVVVTVDCGTMAFAPLEAAADAGLDVIVIDHHMGDARRPRALAVVNPNRMDETSPHRQLAAVGVAFLLAVAVNRVLRAREHFATRRPPDLLALLDLVALGTVCDVVPLTGANRALVTQGLKVMAARGNLGLRTLLDVSRVDERPDTYHAGFILGPRVNAGGRIGRSDYGSRLLCSEDPAEALMLARALDQHNEERKAIEAMVLEQALAQAMHQDNEPLLLIAGPWHPGVIGIVAGRLKERFRRPAAVVALEGDIGKASARSVSGFDFGAAVIAARESGLVLAGGGHAMAAGFSMEVRHLPALHAFLIRRFQQAGVPADGHTLWADACLALAGATAELAHTLSQAAPFGQGNPHPRLALQHVTVASVSPVGADHIRLILTDGNGARLSAMAFRAGGTAFGQGLLRLGGRRVHALGQLKLKTWQGREQVSFILDDVTAV